MINNQKHKATENQKNFGFLQPLGVILVLLFFSFSAFNQVSPTIAAKRSFEDYLIEQAWQNNPGAKILDSKLVIAEENLKYTKKEWLRSFQVSGSITPRDSSILLLVPEDRLTPGTVFPPLYNFGLGWNIGSVFGQKNKNNISKQEIEISRLEIDDERLRFNQEVLTRYHKFILAQEVLKARQAAEEDANANYTLLSSLFQKNKATFEEYNEASISYHNAVEKRLTAETELTLNRIYLEEIVGIPWESLERTKARMDGR
ncbi:MAG: TolC family protein [Saprospiraceae bacterium]